MSTPASEFLREMKRRQDAPIEYCQKCDLHIPTMCQYDVNDPRHDMPAYCLVVTEVAEAKGVEIE